MVHVSPSVESCGELLRGMPALTAVRRELGRVTPDDARTWLDALYAICRQPGGMRVGTLAEALRVDPSVASRKAAHLEAAGLAAREPDPADGRAYRLHPTPAGSAWLDRTIDTYAEHLAGLLTDWSDADVVRLATLLQRLESTLEAERPTGAIA